MSLNQQSPRVVAMPNAEGGYDRAVVAPLFDARLAHMFLAAAAGAVAGILVGGLVYGLCSMGWGPG